MSADYLHNHPQFRELIRIVAKEKGIDPALVEKDYWIMHCLYGLQQLGLKFELKGGTSLSKGFQIIDRFSEDIDIRIDPPPELGVKTGRNQRKPAHIKSRQDFYDWLAATIKIDGVIRVERDTEFDGTNYFSGGIRLIYRSVTDPIEGLKSGVLLEAGFDDVMPNVAKDISSWAYDYAAARIDIIDNRAKGVACYDARYTFVEKLQTVSTKFRKQQETGNFPQNFMRHYYDIWNLLRQEDIQAFIGTEEYNAHKEKRFRQGDNSDLTQNEAFILSDPKLRTEYEKAYNATSALYYGKKPTFDEIIEMIRRWAPKL
jgi:hypothetical protein